MTVFLFWATAGTAKTPTSPVWLVSNGFHTSLAFRVRDLPFAGKMTGCRTAKILLIGWGAGDFYRGRTNPWTFIEALLGIGPSLLHVVPVTGNISERFRHSDVVALRLTASEVKILTGEINRSFARTPNGSYIYIGHGYYHDSRFYLAREHFYFPYMCNTWVAMKLRRSGIPIFIPPAIIAENLIYQAAGYGRILQNRSRPADAF